MLFFYSFVNHLSIIPGNILTKIIYYFKIINVYIETSKFFYICNIFYSHILSKINLSDKYSHTIHHYIHSISHRNYF